MIRKAAIRKNGIIFTGRSHSAIINAHLGALRGGEQGFVTDTGEFVTREQAAEIAFREGQISWQKPALYSEDLKGQPAGDEKT